MSIIGFIVVGDRTSHGGTVVSGDLASSIDGSAIARIGDKATCPRCKRTVTIMTSKDPSFLSGGRPIAFDGDITDCGAILISHHNQHAGLSQDTGVPANVADVSDYVPPQPLRYQEHFILRNQETLEALAGMSYIAKTADGKVFSGETDAEGRTGVVWTDRPMNVDLQIVRSQSDDKDPYHYSDDIDHSGL